MSDRVDIHRMQDLGGGVHVATSNAVKDVTLMGVATEYRREVSRAYIQLSEEEIADRFAADKAFAISRKYDGEAVFIYFEDGQTPEAFAFNAPSGRCRYGQPPLTAIAEKLKAAGVKRALCVGEYYLKGEDGGPRPTHSDILRASFRNKAEEADRLAIALYDLIMLDGTDWRQAPGGFTATWEKLGDLFGTDESAPVHRVSGGIGEGSTIPDRFKEEVADGQEGIVVRKLDALEVFKIKPMLTVDAVVIGYVEDQVENTYGIASLLVALTANGYLREFARVGSGFSDDERVRLLKELSADKVEAPLLKTDSDGRPVQFVPPRLIVEIRGESLEAERLSGRENLTPTFRFADGGYTFHNSQPLPRLIHATFSAFREDKTLSEGGARLAQIMDAETEAAFQPVEAGSSESSILERKVYTKTTKGKTAVRKFLLIHTDGVGRFPFVVHYMDASLGRKEPFQRTLKVANTEDTARDLYNSLIEENVKKGWQEAGTSA